MKYIANPVEVDAFEITKIFRSDGQQCASLVLGLENGAKFAPTPEMVARFVPALGDYVVRQADGYIYLNPKDVFERKYRPVHDCNIVGCQIVGAHEHKIEGPVNAEPNALELGAAARAAEEPY